MCVSETCLGCSFCTVCVSILNECIVLLESGLSICRIDFLLDYTFWHLLHSLGNKFDFLIQ